MRVLQYIGEWSGNKVPVPDESGMRLLCLTLTTLTSMNKILVDTSNTCSLSSSACTHHTQQNAK